MISQYFPTRFWRGGHPLSHWFPHAAGLLLLAGFAPWWLTLVAAMLLGLMFAGWRFATPPELPAFGVTRFVLDRHGLIQSLEPTRDSLFPEPLQNLPGRDARALFSHAESDDTPSELDAWLRAWARGEATTGSLRVRIRRDEGAGIPALLSLESLSHRGQKWVACALRDLGEQVPLERELARQRGLFEGMFNEVPDALVVADRERRMVQCNPAFYRLFQYAPEEVLGHKTILFYASEEEYFHQGRLRFNLAAAKKREPYIVQYRDKNGRVFPGETVGVQLCDANGEITGFLASIRDVGARLEAENELRQSRANLAKAQELARMGSWEWDIPAQRVTWSDEVYRIFELSREQFDQTHRGFLAWIHPGDRDRYKLSEARAFSGLEHDIEHRVILPDGGVKWVHQLGKIQFDARRQPLRLTCTVQDITERKLAEQALQRQTAGLQALNEIAALTDLNAGVQLHRALALGARQLKLDIAIISRIEDQRYVVQYLDAPPEVTVSEGQEFALGKTYCALTLQQNDLVAIDEMGRSTYSNHPCYREFQLETYIGMPLVVQGKIHGTLNFSSPHPYSRVFDQGDRNFVRMLARWCASVLERDWAMTSLRANEDRLQRSQTFANIGTWDWNIQTGELFWSERIAPLFGHPPGALETTYENFLAAIHPEDRPMVVAAVNNCVEHGREYNIEHRVIWPDGGVHWLSEQGNVVRAEDGTPLQMLGVVQDITERRRYQDELARFRQLVESTNQAIGLAKLDGELVYGNAAFRALLQDPKGELVGTNLRASLPRRATPELRAIEQAIGAGQGWKGLLPIRRRDGEEIITHSNVDCVKNDQGKPELLFNIFHDYTPELRRQEELQQAREQAEQANRAKSEFLSNMSHELRTPLNSILGFAQLLENSRKHPLVERQASHVRHILKSGRHLLDLINEVLDLSKIEAGRLSVSMEEVDSGEVLTECLHLISTQAAERGIEPRLQASEPLPVRADRIRLRQIFLNLLSNAIKYNVENGQVWVECRPLPDAKIEYRFNDTGLGVPEDLRAELFQPFNRLHAEYSQVEGTGIGLALTKKLVEHMGGCIGYHPREEGGSCFWVILPATTRVVAEEAPVSIPQSPMAEHPGGTILYVEDNPANVELMNEITASLSGIQLLVARDGETGLALAARERPDAIVLDLNLPGIGGLDVARKLRADGATMPLIALTADAMDITQHKAKRAGFDHFLTKPLNVVQFQRLLTDCFNPPGSECNAGD